MSEYVERLPSGYGTLVGERGVSLSGGQRQRLSIARSIMLHPQVIVFDDSTAAIDAATEQRIRAALQEVTSDRATIIISHRLSSLMHADEILFLEGGKIVERGSHAELLELGGSTEIFTNFRSVPRMTLMSEGVYSDGNIRHNTRSPSRRVIST